MKTLQQIFSIARTEFRFGLRRGAPVVVTAVLGLILGAGILMNIGNNVQMADPYMEQYTPEQVAKLAQNGITADIYRSLSQGEFADLTAIDTTQTWFFLYLALLFLPVATAGTIPADRQFGVLELLRSMPLGGNIYLFGKILGVINISSLEMLRSEARKVRNLPKSVKLTHHVLHISAENAPKLEYQELLQVFIDRGAKVWIHTNNDKGRNRENVERIFFLGLFSAWLGEQFKQFELKNEAARLGYPKGYFSVAAYFADPLFQTVLDEATAQRAAAVSA